jgi:hypothetical protein
MPPASSDAVSELMPAAITADFHASALQRLRAYRIDETANYLSYPVGRAALRASTHFKMR